MPVTNIYRDEIVKEQELPIKMTAFTPCFRREAGSFGSDVRGLNRVHQFDKVEIIQLVKPEGSYEVLEAMVSHVEQLLIQLELAYWKLSIILNIMDLLEMKPKIISSKEYNHIIAGIVIILLAD